jgi:DNA-binding MarR family transcriptional regulator
LIICPILYYDTQTILFIIKLKLLCALMQDFDENELTLITLLSEIGTIEQIARSTMDSALPGNLNVSNFALLNHFSRRKDEKTPLQLSKAFNVTKGAMTNTLNKLENMGYIHIRPDWEDARKKLVSISQSGIDARNNALATIKGLLINITENGDNPKIKDLLTELRKFRETVENSFQQN